MSPGVATPWPAAPPIPIAKVCLISVSPGEAGEVAKHHHLWVLGSRSASGLGTFHGSPTRWADLLDFCGESVSYAKLSNGPLAILSAHNIHLKSGCGGESEAVSAADLPVRWRGRCVRPGI